MSKKPEITAYVVREQPNRIPSNYFLQWLKEKIPSEIKINLHHRYYKDLDDFNDNGNRFLSNFITTSDIRKWNPSDPVLISAQTGSGKNTFVQKTLLKYAVEHTEPEKRINLMLVLSNRIALGRQGKRQFAERVAKHMGDSKYVRMMEEYYTPEGIDHLYVDLGIVTVCSYHQLFERKLLDNRKYKYIVCDEAHFFTSDSTFNHDTNDILKYIISNGADSVRIYMTATIETVFEAIIREEYAPLEASINDMDEKMSEAVNGADFRMLKHNSTVDGNSRDYSLETVNANYQTMKENFLPLQVQFYHMERHYEYINEITVYHSHEDLAKKVIASKGTGKWMIFVSNREFGKSILQDIQAKDTEKSLKCACISAKFRASLEKKQKKIYDNIIEKEAFKKDVLITTSLLDNGINIKDDSVKYIAIDAFDKPQFLQMLGRLRIESKRNLHLYIRGIDEDALKKGIRKDVTSLIERLQLDGLTNEIKTNIYDGKIHRLTQTGEVEYNPCAVYHLIDSISHKMRIIRLIDPNYFLDFNVKKKESSSTLDLSRKVYQVHHEALSSQPWSRSVVDILEEAEDAEDRKLYGNIKSGWEYTFDQTFDRYFLGEMMPEYFENLMKDTINKKKDALISLLNPGQVNEFNIRLYESTQSQPITEYEKLKRLSEFVNYIKPDIVSMGFRDIELLQEKRDFYRSLVDDSTISSPLDEQLRWMEKLNRGNVEGNITGDDIEEFIRTHAVSEGELEKQKSGNYYNQDFLKNHGIPINTKNPTQDEKVFSQKYLGVDSIKDKLNDLFDIDGVKYILTSYVSTKTRTTYYLFVRKDTHLGIDEKAKTSIHQEGYITETPKSASEIDFA